MGRRLMFGVLLVATLWCQNSDIASAAAMVAVNIESTPPGATVFVDAETAVPLGVTPMRRVRVPKGGHILIFKLAGHEDTKLPVNVRKWGETFSATLTPLAVIVINASGESASEALVRIDGEPAGQIPVKKTVKPGRHLVQIGKVGYRTFSQWVEVVGGQVLQLPVVLERDPAKGGSLFVMADVTGAPVFVDGKQRGGTPVVIDGLSPGDHIVEIRPTSPRVQAHQQVVQINSGEQTTIDLKLGVAPDSGSIRVITNVPGAMISIDGVDIGLAPAAKAGLTPGPHILMTRADGYQPIEQSVEVVAGRERVASLRMQAATGVAGRIVVNANVDGAQIWIDGTDRGAAPVVVEGATPGAHAIVVKAPGHREIRQTCEVGPGLNCIINADLRAVGTSVRVESNAKGAELYVDGELQGPVPWEGDLPSGSHRLEVRATGYDAHVEQVNLRVSKQVRLIQTTLSREGDLSPVERDEQRENQKSRARNALSHTGGVLPTNLAVLDLSIGFPYLFEMRLSVGILKFLDAGVAVRTFGRLTEFEGRAKFGWQPIEQISFGAQARLGGGIGAQNKGQKTNNVFFSVDAIGSLHFGQAGAFSLRLGVDFHGDRWAFAGNDSDVAFAGKARQRLARARLGGSFDFILSRKWNLFTMIEGTFSKRRRIVGDLFGAGNEDKRILGRLGFTYKFGTSGE